MWPTKASKEDNNEKRSSGVAWPPQKRNQDQQEKRASATIWPS